MKRAIALVLALAMVFTCALTVSASGNYDGTPHSYVAQDIAIEAASEGIVLLKNGEITSNVNALPLAAGAKVNVFGKTADNPYYDGGGSGATTASTRRVNFYNALTAAGIEFNTGLRSWYSSASTVSGETGGRAEVSLATLQAANIWQDAQDYSDTAIFVTGRSGSEFSDNVAGSLNLKASEDAVIKALGSVYENLIIVFNVCTWMQADFVEDPAYGVDAALICWAPGDFGFTALAGILNGTYNPSGHLADTITISTSEAPAYLNFGNFQYTGTFPIANNPTGTNWNTSGAASQNKFLEYEEGIYVGYRYFETFKPERVVYPFGYGLSYTDFTWSNYRQSRDGDIVTVKVDVKNTGAVAGKDVVQVYVEQPYTEGGIEKAKRVLAGYGKTKLLAPTDFTTVTVSFNLYDIASWDLEDGNYLCEAGQYKVFASTDASEAGKVFNSTFTLASDRVFENDPMTGTKLENQFEDARGEGTVLSRADHDGTYPTAPTSKGMPDEFRSTIDKFPEPTTEGTAYPFSASQGSDPVQLQAIYDKAEEDVDDGTFDNMSDALWNSPLWDTFISQLTLTEAVDLCRQGGYQTIGNTRLGIARTVDNDGPQQSKARSGGGIGGNGTAMPIATGLACTWNDELLERVGWVHGADAVLVGIQSWYAPAMNIHRTPYSGRNFEYYSEDPLLSGKAAAAIVRGVQSNKIGVTLKHFALNDCETNRSGVNTWADEQTIREIYLKAFEIPVKEAKAVGIMTAFNRIGHVWAGGSPELLTNVLRGEWGFRGYVVTDYYSGGYMLPPLMIMAENDISLGNANQASMLNYNNQINPIGMSNALARSVKNLCYFKMRTILYASDEEIPTPEPMEPTETLSGTYKAKLNSEGKVDTIIINVDRNVPNSDIFGEDLFDVPGYNVELAYISDENGVELPMEYDYISLAVTPQEPTKVIDIELKKSFGLYKDINFTNGGFILDNLSKSFAYNETVTVPITALYADHLSGVKGTVAYDDSLLRLESITAADGFMLQSKDGNKFTVISKDGMGVSDDVVVGYAVFKVIAQLVDDEVTTVSFPYETLTGYSEDPYSEDLINAIIPAVDVTIFAEPPMPGDVNLDGQVNLADAILLLQYLSKNADLTSRQLKAADVVSDGDINTADVVVIMQMCL